MDAQLTPPPPSQSSNKRIIIIVAVVAALVAVAILGVIALGVFGFKRVQEQKAAARAATDEIQKTVQEERARMADSIRKGEIGDSDSALGRMKDQLEKSAGQLTDADAAATRAMAAYMGKIQGKVHDYQVAATRFTEAKVFSPAYTERSGLEEHRKLVKDFLANNEQLADVMRRGDELVRAELDAAKVPPKTRDATLGGFTRSQLTTRPIQARVRDCDKRLGEAAIAVLDLFDKNWGKWKRDPESGQVIFQDNDTLVAFNALIERVQAAAAEQQEAQQQLLRLAPSAPKPR